MGGDSGTLEEPSEDEEEPQEDEEEPQEDEEEPTWEDGEPSGLTTELGQDDAGTDEADSGFWACCGNAGCVPCYIDGGAPAAPMGSAQHHAGPPRALFPVHVYRFTPAKIADGGSGASLIALNDTAKGVIGAGIASVIVFIMGYVLWFSRRLPVRIADAEPAPPEARIEVKESTGEAACEAAATEEKPQNNVVAFVAPESPPRPAGDSL